MFSIDTPRPHRTRPSRRSRLPFQLYAAANLDHAAQHPVDHGPGTANTALATGGHSIDGFWWARTSAPDTAISSVPHARSFTAPARAQHILRSEEHENAHDVSPTAYSPRPMYTQARESPIQGHGKLGVSNKLTQQALNTGHIGITPCHTCSSLSLTTSTNEKYPPLYRAQNLTAADGPACQVQQPAMVLNLENLLESSPSVLALELLRMGAEELDEFEALLDRSQRGLLTPDAVDA